MKKRESKLQFAADEIADITGNTCGRDDKNSDDNAGTDSARAAIDVTERGVNATESAYRSYRDKRQPQHNTGNNANRSSGYSHSRTSQRGHGEAPNSKSPKTQQKRAIKKDYAAAKSGKGAKRSAAASRRAAKAARDTEKKTVFILRHRKGLIALALIAVLMLFLFGAFSACSVLFEGGAGAFGSTTYPASDEDILAAEALYCTKEAALQSKIDYYASNTNYDEYHYNVGPIGHSPHALISAISVLHPAGWTVERASDTIEAFFDLQYVFTEEVVTETRYRTETRTAYLVYTDPDTGYQYVYSYDYEVEVPYEYTICTVTVEVTDLLTAAASIMTDEQFTMFYNYIMTLGNRPYLFMDS